MSADHKRSHDSELQWKASHWHAADWGRAIKQSIGLQDSTVLNMHSSNRECFWWRDSTVNHFRLAGE